MKTKNIRITIDLLDLPDNDFVMLVIRGKLTAMREYVQANGAEMVEIVTPLGEVEHEQPKVN